MDFDPVVMDFDPFVTKMSIKQLKWSKSIKNDKINWIFDRF